MHSIPSSPFSFPLPTPSWLYSTTAAKCPMSTPQMCSSMYAESKAGAFQSHHHKRKLNKCKCLKRPVSCTAKRGTRTANCSATHKPSSTPQLSLAM